MFLLITLTTLTAAVVLWGFKSRKSGVSAAKAGITVEPAAAVAPAVIQCPICAADQQNRSRHG